MRIPTGEQWRAALETLRSGRVVIRECNADGSLGKVVYDSAARRKP